MELNLVVVHGGAAPIAKERICGKLCGVQTAVKLGSDALRQGGKAIEAVEAAIKYLESDDYFNAGFGSVLNLEGEVEMDASIMNGSKLQAGAVAMVKDVEHPISLARLVSEKSPHVLIAGNGTRKFAEEHAVPIVENATLVSDYAKSILETFKTQGANMDTIMLGGTVGAVALDRWGNVAAGTSTGGTNGKFLGRIGDTPLIGSCTFADNNIGAVSCTGHGEAIIKTCMGYSIIKEIELGRNPFEAIKNRIDYLDERIGSKVGAIAISKKGDIGIHFTSPQMPWAYIKNKEMHYGVNPNEDECICI